MVSKDQTIGGAIFIVCAVLGVLYVVTLFYPPWLSLLGLTVPEWAQIPVQFWVIAVPVLIAFVAVMGIGAWIGWTMATTPPPKPIEELTSEMEEKKEETTPPPPEKTEEIKEEKKPEKKKKEDK
jgi:predicted DNA-binding transcriptional regulator